MHRSSSRVLIFAAALVFAGTAWTFAMQLVSTNVIGGRGGRAFSDSQIPADARVTEVRIQAGDRVDSVQMVYALSDGRTVAGPLHGGSGGRPNVFTLDSDEYITGISGRYGDNIDSMRIQTNKRTTPLYGGRGGDRDFRIDVPGGHQAVGFAGRAGDYLDAVGLVCAPIRVQAAQTVISGGGGGSVFADPGIPAGARIAEVRVWTGDLVDSIQMIYMLPDGRIVEGQRHGGSGGNAYSFPLETNEYIIGISGRYGDRIDSVRIQTNRRTSQLFGGRGGNRDFRVNVPGGCQAIGFAGRAGQYLDAIGLTYMQFARGRR